MFTTSQWLASYALRRGSHLAVLLATGMFFAIASTPSLAVPIQGQFQDNPNFCDSHPTTTFSHELGDITMGFPLDEGLQVAVTNTNQVVCVGDDGAPNDFLVTITNLSPFGYKDLFFVVDDGANVGNVDGGLTDLNAPGFTDAFKIDNVGGNNNLVAGDFNNNLILDPGEFWEFLVTNFLAPASTPPFPFFGSVGKFAGSSAADSQSNASIVANRIPEPATCLLMVLGLTVAALRRS